MIYKHCPKCHKRYYELANYCTKCGIELEKEKNMCTEMKTSMCAHIVYDDDDLYCQYCGALTTYATEKAKKEQA